jgi:pilus assembly protein Flp/PilA
MKAFVTKFVRDGEGQDLIEYALLAATIALGVFAAMSAVKDALNTEFTNIASSITSAS